MKKEYVKPEIVFESFKMSSSIAVSCGEKISSDINSCEYEFGWDVFFSDANQNCTSKDTMDCYDVPMHNTNVFVS